MKKFKFALLSGACAMMMIGFTGHASAQNFDLTNASGASAGTVMLTETPAGVLLTIEAEGLEPGATHAIHIHEKGLCTPSDTFKDAGGHFNPAHANHGMMDAEGAHAGDMPNLHADSEGKAKVEILNTGVTTNDVDMNGRHTLHDADGSALIIHMGKDDYKSQPTGDAGDRYACAVLSAPRN